MRPIPINWNVDLGDDTAEPFDRCYITFTFTVNPFGRRRIRRITDDMRDRPDLTVDLTIGRGLWRRNGRLRVTGPYYAVRPAADALHSHLTA